MKKKLLALLLACCMVFGMLPAVSAAETGSGTLEDGMTWSLDSSGTLTISGTGPMMDFDDWDDIPWYQYATSITKVVVKPGITTIGARAISEYDRLTSVSLPEGITSIGTQGISNNRSLTTITLPESLESIGSYAFLGNTSLTTLEIPESVTSIGSRAFSNCESLLRIAIPEGITEIGEHVLSWCKSLVEVDLPDSLTTIGSHAFMSCYHLKSVTIPSGVTTIGESAFSQCSSLTEVEIPEGVTSIGPSAFYHCEKLTTISLPSTVEFIGEQAFNLCRSLTAFQVDENNTNFTNDSNGALYSKDYTTLYQIPGAAASFTIPSTVTNVNYGAFRGCANLTEVTIPNSVTAIGDWAFSDCDSLTEVVIPDSVTELGKYAFAYCDLLENVTLPENLTVLNYRAFRECLALTEITIPAGITELDDGVFDGCIKLAKVYFLSDAPTFGENDVFGSVTATCFYPAGNPTWNDDTLQQYGGTLTWVAVDEDPAPSQPTDPKPTDPEPTDPEPTEPQPTEPSIPEESEYSGSCGEGIYWTFDPDTGVLSIFGSGTMTTNDYTSPWKRLRDQILKIEFAPEVTNIGEYAFQALKSLKRVVIPEHVVSIGFGAFTSCSSLKEVVIRGPVTELRSTFSQCRGLVSVILPNTVEIMSETFNGCQSLETVDLPVNLKVMNSVFHGCYKLKEVVVPEGVVDIDGSFWNCWNLTKVDLPDSVENLGSRTFGCCHDLKMITIPENVKYIGSWAFDWVDVRSKTPRISGVQTIFFTGDAPEFHEEAFYSMSESKITCFYPQNNSTWTKSVLQNYGGNVTWKAYDPAEAGNPFTDVKSGDYYFEPVLWALENNITGGTSANTFSPNASCSRGQIVTFLWAAAGRPEPTSYYNPFTDVKESDYFYKAVLWAVENGITSGMDETTFGSSRPCTRAQVVTFLWAAVGRPEPTGGYNPFTDVKETDYYYKAVLFAMEYGITSGMSSTTFGSNSTCTRAHVVTFLYRTFWG